ncbi:FAD binding domain-containing protein, partial [Hansschlegelia beijingensis]
MMNFSYARAESVAEAISAVSGDPHAHYIAGGTNLVDLMKYDVERPGRLVDITRLPLREITAVFLRGPRQGLDHGDVSASAVPRNSVHRLARLS